MVAADDVVAHHEAGAHEKVRERPLRVVVHEGDGLACAYVHTFALFLFAGLRRLAPGDEAEFAVYRPQTQAWSQPFEEFLHILKGFLTNIRNVGVFAYCLFSKLYLSLRKV